MLSQHPQFEQDPEKYLEHRFHELLLHWLDHVGGYLLQKDSFNIEIVFFERFLLSFDFQLEELIKYLDLKLERSHTATIKEQTSFELLKENNPYHLHRGTYGQWKDQLSSDQKSDADKIVGPMLELLGYPVKEEDFGSRLPTYPRESEPVIFKEARFAGRGNLYDQARYAISLLRSRRPFSEKLAKGMDYLLKKGRWDQSS
jgi:aryl sulfotransferase